MTTNVVDLYSRLSSVSKYAVDKDELNSVMLAVHSDTDKVNEYLEVMESLEFESLRSIRKVVRISKTKVANSSDKDLVKMLSSLMTRLVIVSDTDPKVNVAQSLNNVVPLERIQAVVSTYLLTGRSSSVTRSVAEDLANFLDNYKHTAD